MTDNKMVVLALLIETLYIVFVVLLTIGLILYTNDYNWLWLLLLLLLTPSIKFRKRNSGNN